ncbi:unnamed protein product [Effrenium voratum]|nr:unnamed protein product [Effrenium voratum]
MAEAQSAREAEDQRSAFQALARQAEEELASLAAKHEREAERASKRAEWLAEIPSSALEQTPWQYTCGPGSGAGKHGRKEKKEEKRNQKAQEKAQSRSLRMAERRSPNGYEGGDLQSFKDVTSHRKKPASEYSIFSPPGGSLGELVSRRSAASLKGA